MKTSISMLWILIPVLSISAGEIDDRTVVIPAQPKRWYAFPLSHTRLTPGGPFHRAMTNSGQYLLDMDVNRMLYRRGRRDNTPPPEPYPGSNQPADTRPGDLPHYISGISLMYGQTGDRRFLDRVNYLMDGLKQAAEASGGNSLGRVQDVFEQILSGRLTLEGPDELGYPWGGVGNFFYGIHKWLAAFRDASLYCGNSTAMELWIDRAEPITEFVLRANPDLFDNLLDIEHGGMNEVFADLYALTGDRRYMDVSLKFNHQKVILPTANGRDVLYGRHANMQVPTFVGAARQYQLTGDEVSHRAASNFLDLFYRDHMLSIGGNSRYERFGRPGEITKRLGFTTAETCNTYNMLKVALQQFETTGDLRHMDYFERALFNHILASQDPDTGGVTYYVSMMPGGFKSYSARFDLSGIWCCVGTGMENHSKYGEAIYFHNHQNLLVNLFIASTLEWPEKGLKLDLETRFPEEDVIRINIRENGSFDKPIDVRCPSWVTRAPRAWINGERVTVSVKPGGLIRLSAPWKAGDQIQLEMPQGLRLEPAPDDPFTATILHGPLVLAGELGKERMPGSDLVQRAIHYNEWIAPTEDIPILIADKGDLDGWIKRTGESPLRFRTLNAGRLDGETRDVTLIPFHQMHHQRYNVYWKLYSPAEMALRQRLVSDEINPASADDEARHGLRGENLHRSVYKDDRHFWENNRFGRSATNGGWFSYQMKLVPNETRQHLVVTYWGSSEKTSVFELDAGGETLRREDLFRRWPLTYFEECYELPEALVRDRDSLTIRFQAEPGQVAGPVFALRVTSNPARFPNYLFY